MKILHFAPVSSNTTEGLSQSIVNLVTAQSKNGHDVGLITVRTSEKIVGDEVFWKSWDNKSLFNLFFYNPFNKIKNEFGIPDIINLHDIYNLKQIFILRHAIKSKFRIFITPRGSFSPVALKRSKIKKLIFINLFIKPHIRNIEGFGALNKGEEFFIKNLFHKKTIIIGNGIKNNKRIFEINSLAYDEKNNSNEYSIGFVGRFDVHIKGLDTLLKAYVEYQKESQLRNIKLVFLGEHRIKNNEYDSNKYFEFIRNQLKNSSLFQVIPAIYGDDKYKEISKFDLLIQPSRTEGMPNTVLEAMSIGIPCCVSPETNMGDIISKSGGGWVVNRTVNDLINFFLLIEKYDKKDLHKIGINGMEYAYKNLLWDQIGKQKYE